MSNKHDYGLYCNGTEILNGVKSMNILYGEDTDNDGSVNRYVPADQSGLDFSKVNGVIIDYELITSPFNRTPLETENFKLVVPLRNLQGAGT